MIRSSDPEVMLDNRMGEVDRPCTDGCSSLKRVSLLGPGRAEGLVKEAWGMYELSVWEAELS